jgi:outer membrane lipoprotein SlyB
MNNKQQIIIGAIIALVTVFLIGCQTSQELKEETYTSSNATEILVLNCIMAINMLFTGTVKSLLRESM